MTLRFPVSSWSIPAVLVATQTKSSAVYCVVARPPFRPLGPALLAKVVCELLPKTLPHITLAQGSVIE